ncbi:MAG: hypothetical protein ACRDTO_01625 [Mycobacterium sp.]
MDNRPILKGVMRGGNRNGYPTVARAIMRNLNGFVDARRHYADVSVPVTLVYGERDWSHPAERDHVANLLSDAQRITLPALLIVAVVLALLMPRAPKPLAAESA